MIDWVNARQHGVDRSRNEIGNSKCMVFIAVEVNKVYDGKSADGLKMYRGIDYIRQYMVPTSFMKGEKVVFIGKINEHENRNGRIREYVRNFCDLMMGVYFAQDIPYIFIGNFTPTKPKRDQKGRTGFLLRKSCRGTG